MKAIDLIAPLVIKGITSDIPQALSISKITQDTREIEKNSLFICIEGAIQDGHKLVEEAVSRGATLIIASKKITVSVPVVYVADTTKAMAVLADSFYEHPSQRLRVIGVTGTNGKTTVTHLLDQIFRNHGETTGVIGTMYRRIGDKLFTTKNTTPDSITLQKTLSEMNDAGVTTCSMEVSSHALVQGRVWGTDFDVAIFTNLSQDHLEYHRTMEGYAHAKELLFSQLGNSYQNTQPKYAVLNVDDSVGRSYQNKTAAQIYSYGIEEPADFRALELKTTNKGTSFILLFQGKKHPVHMQMIGKFNVSNALASIAAAYASGINLASVIDSMEKIKGVRGRFEVVQGVQNFTVIVDYAHTPDGLLNVLDAVNEIKTGKVYCIVGCGGDRDRTKRPIMAEVAIANSDYVIFTSDNPRTEEPQDILDEMVVNLKAGTYQMILDRKKAIQAAVNQATTNDIILIAGKGHEDYQIIGTTKHHFDDVEEVEKAIKLKNLKM
ncbi:UDP-N-acetylmuramoylalanyl-D-glutamate--2,6-diaminopimelate ligase [Carnobacterium iners]|uniref:UDP-N-acetylmuramoyl-L-alanyl-D-glutamate--2,6-diaminopimelate ligase n=1 Tax=Carnobacterium iners TaxID=1073423 RepID=A0A1X7NPJ8_9LACT|nr:UDP-N-acetylmuramoyl-L-alanyl-D-glutamate--2,6-diaminopimelate ligase [Carnobacterium iners]SEK30475.1 UDP-N-acetylmuramoylalanyl-D-glutamate--2,6-diaminopimelate ligase [Carnobacterium iners]SMH39555.1 UDP-N-acetylmuramoylalanyl-D-glutamate--2,6-diaminopimelate ligase [Carnobacterium iners]